MPITYGWFFERLMLLFISSFIKSPCNLNYQMGYSENLHEYFFCNLNYSEHLHEYFSLTDEQIDGRKIAKYHIHHHEEESTNSTTTKIQLPNTYNMVKIEHGNEFFYKSRMTIAIDKVFKNTAMRSHYLHIISRLSHAFCFTTISSYTHDCVCY